MSDNTASSLAERVDWAIAQSDALARLLDEEVELLRRRDYAGLRELNARKEALEETLKEVTEVSLEVAPDGPLAERIRAAQERLSAALERNRRMNQAHQDAIARLQQAIRDSSREAEDPGLYTAEPGKRKARGRHGFWRDV